ncbi:type IV secretion system protein VirB5 [Bartonella silvatica]|uniref:Type IV secretion system protein VirB5 n=1 Tax=Bartonella silvatica TaxID=357760 RepID=A0ABV2HF72_9HYPH
MKKVIIAAIIATILGTSNSAMAWNWFGAGAVDLSAGVPSWPTWGGSSSSKAPAPKKPPAPKKVHPFATIIDLLKKQLEETKEIRGSIRRNGNSSATKKDYTSFFLKNPELLYSLSEDSEILKSVQEILAKEEASHVNDQTQARALIERRKQYVAAVDKVVSLQTFQDAQKRFEQISQLVEQINKTTDLKSIAELQARIKGMLAMIQNESTKLQMVSYSRNAEQTLINQQKQIRNMRILNSKNQNMPTIRAIR